MNTAVQTENSSECAGFFIAREKQRYSEIAWLAAASICCIWQLSDYDWLAALIGSDWLRLDRFYF